MIRLNSCCCFSLDNAGKLIGFLGFLTAIVTAIGDTAVLVDIDTVLENSTNYINFDPATLKLTTQIYTSVNLALSIAHIFTSLCLIVGTVKRNQVLITPWLVTQGIDIALSLVVTFVVSILYMINFGSAGILLFAVGVLGLGISIYFWLAIFSLLSYMRDGLMRPLLGNENDHQYTRLPTSE